MIIVVNIAGRMTDMIIVIIEIIDGIIGNLFTMFLSAHMSR